MREEIDENKYVPHDHCEFSTDDPKHTIEALDEQYPKSEGFKVVTNVIDTPPGVRSRGSKIVIADIYREKKNRLGR